MKISATLNGVKTSKELPTWWDQVTFEQFIKLKDIQTGEEIKALSILLDIDFATMQKATVQNLLTDVIPNLAFLALPLPQDVPKSSLGYLIPKDLNVQEVARYEDLKLILEQMPKEGEPVTDDHLRLYAEMMVVYAMPDYIKSTEQEKKYLAEQFMKAPCSEVMAVGNFTLAKYLGLRASTVLGLRPTSRPLRRIRLALLIWRKSLAFKVRSMLWRNRLRSPVIK